MQRLVDILWNETWWKFDRQNLGGYALCAHWFNLFEATAWFACGVFVGGRYLRCQKSLIELAYSISFLLFGMTDLIEAYRLTSWLLWFKLMILLPLIRLRRYVRTELYPGSKLV